MFYIYGFFKKLSHFYIYVRMCMVRLASEEREGQILRNNLLRNLWEDVEKRAKQLGVSSCVIDTSSLTAIDVGISL